MNTWEKKERREGGESERTREGGMLGREVACNRLPLLYARRPPAKLIFQGAVGMGENCVRMYGFVQWGRAGSCARGPSSEVQERRWWMNGVVSRMDTRSPLVRLLVVKLGLGRD